MRAKPLDREFYLQKGSFEWQQFVRTDIVQLLIAQKVLLRKLAVLNLGYTPANTIYKVDIY